MSGCKSLGGHLLFALGLQFKYLYSALAAGDDKGLDAEDNTRRAAAFSDARFVYLDALAADLSGGDRP